VYLARASQSERAAHRLSPTAKALTKRNKRFAPRNAYWSFHMNVKSLFSAVALASALAAPAVSFAQQSNGPVTRAQVRGELVQLENAGWRPAMSMGNSPDYPAGIQAAEAKVAAQNGATGVGGVVSGSSASGTSAATRPTAHDGIKSIYFGQ
jgi:Domain of unknown function (DUF4148)